MPARKRFKIFLLFLFFLMSATNCAPHPSRPLGVTPATRSIYENQARVYANMKVVENKKKIESCEVVVEESKFEKTVRYVGCEIQANADTSFKFRSWKDKKTAKVEHQIYLVNIISKSKDETWEHWYAANDEDANSLKFARISHDVNCSTSGCMFFEIFGISIDDKYMRESADTGFQIKIYAKSGKTEVLTIPGNVIEAQLKTIDGNAIKQQK